MKGASFVKNSLFAKTLLFGFCAGLVVAGHAGLATAFHETAANRFLSHGFFRLAALSFQEKMLLWEIWGGAAGLTAGLLVFPLLFLFAWRGGARAEKEGEKEKEGKVSTGKRPGPRVSSSNARKRLLLTVPLAAALYLWVGWLVNHHWLPHKFHPLSLLFDFLLLLYLAFWGALLARASGARLYGLFGGLAFVFLFFLLSLELYAQISARTGLPRSPNIVIVLSDALGARHVGCYGYARETTPNVDAFAKEARLFRHAFAQAPSTKPAVASLFTAVHPSRHAVVYNEDRLSLKQVTLAEVLRQHKYHTAGFIENPTIGREFQYDQGFETWVMDDRRLEDTSEPMDEMDRRTLQWLDRRHKTPFFLYLHYMDPHGPYRAPAPFDRFFDKDYKGEIDGNTPLLGTPEWWKDRPRDLEHLVSLYDDEIRYVDWRFGNILRKLRELGQLDNTIVVFMSDHGEAFLEHGYFFHSMSVYHDQINIPLIVRYPRLFPAGVEERQAQQIDLFPTLLAAAGIEPPGDCAGRNLLAAEWKTDVPGIPAGIVSEHLRRRKGWGEPQRAYILGDWKLVQALDTWDEQLFHLPADPADSRNVLAENPDVADRAGRTLDEWVKNIEENIEAEKAELSEEMIDKLKSLGYIK